MPQITDVRFDPLLSNISLKRRNNAMIGDNLFPIVPVRRRTGEYFVYGQEHFTVRETLRAPRTRANEIDWRVTRKSFRAQEHALIHLIEDAERDEAVNPIDLDVDATELLTDTIALGREKRIASIVRDPLVVPNETLTGTAQWGDPASDPFLQARTARRAIRAAIGKAPNLAIIPYDVMQVLMEHEAIFARMNTAANRVIDIPLLQTFFGVSRILVPEAVENVANEGQTADLEDVWGRDVIFAYVEASPGLKRMSLGYTFRVSAPRTRNSGPGMGDPVRRWREEDRHSDAIEVGYTEATHLVAAGAAYLVRNAIAAL